MPFSLLTRLSPRTGWLAVVSILVALAAAGCARKDAAAETKPNEVRHPLRGEIREVRVAENILVVRHEEIPGYMPGMTMEFTVNSGDAANARPGQRIRAELVERNGDYTLERIWPDEAGLNGRVDVGAQALLQDTVAKGRNAYREVGEEVPDFVLLDQEGRVVDSTRFRGKRVVLNFIFTRCPVATMCPASVAKFQQLQRETREAGIQDVELVSISLDPLYDTPGVLREYVMQRAIDTSNYTFLTGPETAVQSLLKQFGILTELRGELLNHTLATLLVGPDGRILHRADGSGWTVKEFMERLAAR